MIRTILSFAFAAVFLIAAIPILFIEWIISKFNKHAADLSSLRIVQWAFRVILTICGTKVTEIGMENIPTDTAVLYTSNHRSWFDIMLAYSRCPGLTGFVAKSNIERVPLLSSWMRRLYCLFMNREDLKESLKCINQGADYLKQGVSIFIFPEGTRCKTDDIILPFKEGSFKMAQKSGCPIVPVAITNTREIYENHLPYAKSCKVIIEYGKPFYISDLPKEERKFVGARTQNIVEQMLIKNEKLI